SGIAPWTAGAPWAESWFKEAFFDKFGRFGILEFYATHPKDFLDLLRRCARFFFLNAYTYGNFEKSAGRPPHAVSLSWGVWGKVRALLPGSIWFIFGLLLFHTIAAVVSFKPIKAVMLLVISLSALNFLTVAIGSGDVDVTRQGLVS